MKRRTSLIAAFAASVLAIPLATVPAYAAPEVAKDLIFSEYVEGSSSNKYLEIYNGTAGAIDLSAYSIELYTNGKTTAGKSQALESSLPAGNTYVIANSQAKLNVKANLVSAVTNFNGDDVLVLKKGEQVVDSIGKIGDATKFGENVTLIRKPAVISGDTNPDDAFDPKVEWTQSGMDDVSNLGKHSMDGSTAADPADPGTDDPGTEEPGDPNTGDPGSPNPDDTNSAEQCKLDATKIGEVQGAGATSPKKGESVTVQGTVVGTFQSKGATDGYFIQDLGDGDVTTSDGIFVYDPKKVSGDVKVGSVVRVNGKVSEYAGTAKSRWDDSATQISPTSVVSCGESGLPAPTIVDFPNTDYEAYEGMLVTYAKPLTVLEVYQYGRFGEIAVGPETQFQPTALFPADTDQAQKLYDQNNANRITIDDGRGDQNATPALHPATLKPLTMQTLFRVGDKISDLVGVMDYRFSKWRIQPTLPGTIENVNPRPEVPSVGGNLKVASANVLNYFTTLKKGKNDKYARGAETAEEFQRQEAKIVAELNLLDAAVIGLNEIENNGTAVETLVAALNKASEPGKWAAIKTGKVGTDAITTALIYQPKLVQPVGNFDILTKNVDSRFIDTKNRPTIAQTFKHLATNETITIAVNHLKSKGSKCKDPSEATLGHLVGNCQETRVKAVHALTDWLKGDKIKVEKSDNILVIGDMNSYDHEDPIKTFENAGYTDMVKKFHGENAYSYVYNGQLGYLDYALANETLKNKIKGAADWHINSLELPIIDYTMGLKKDNEDRLFAEDPYRSSDHDPVLVGIQMGKAADTNPDDPGEKPTPDPEPKPTPEDPKPVVVSPEAPIFPSVSDPVSCKVKPFVTIVPKKGVSYSVTVDGKELTPVAGNVSKFEYDYGKTVTVKATADKGYELAKGAKAEWAWTAPTREALKCTIPAIPLEPAHPATPTEKPSADDETQKLDEALKAIIDQALKDLQAGGKDATSNTGKDVTSNTGKDVTSNTGKDASAAGQKPLAHTGATVAGLSIGAAILLLAGGAIAVIRRRQS
ncbi:ExeM/NucH family extracellular endonuclease [Trueperella pecoris]|uniref:ExeM/NucH family extracellular endonuclease n=1 Tax=Trueperella pecoris TaxID=2733571 RepID=A0A7M1R110_9ACTO|nr:ExeM/NucH family extracellular endonuclease [Trueperella pecoris]QOR47970.1 ExeM/NucH family extracellular endonuclease [Trueperella pecoris]